MGFGSLAALENNKNLGNEEDVVVDTIGRESLAHSMEGNKRSSGDMKRKESVRKIKAGVSRMINTLSRSRCGTSFAVLGLKVDHTIRGDPFITFAPRGERWVKEVANFANDKTDRLRETANKGGGGPKSRKFCERNKWMPPKEAHS